MPRFSPLEPKRLLIKSDTLAARFRSPLSAPAYANRWRAGNQLCRGIGGVLVECKKGEKIRDLSVS